MNLSSLIVKEIVHRKGNFLLSLMALAAAVALYVAAFTTGEASNRETSRLMRDLGLNLRVVSEATEMNRFFDKGYADQTLPEEYAQRLADYAGFTSNHLTAYLIRSITWRNMQVLLTGIAPEICPPGKRNLPMIHTMEPGTLYVGFEVAKALHLKTGDKVELLEKPFKLIGCGPETGTEEDIRVQCHLRDAQALLKLPGQINEIRAIDCLCQEFRDEGPEDTLARLRAELSQVLPDAKVIRINAIAQARRNQRVLIEDYLNYLVLPLVAGACLIWLGVLFMLNVRERREEIGILRALGFGNIQIAGLFLGRALSLGFVGALLGFAGGTALSLLAGPEIFKVTAKALVPNYSLLGLAILAAPGFAGLAALIPSFIAVTQDPAASLRQE